MLLSVKRRRLYCLIYFSLQLCYHSFINKEYVGDSCALYAILMDGTNVFLLWIVSSLISPFFPILSKYLRNRRAQLGKGLEITALVIGLFDFYFVFFAATKINLFFIYIAATVICVLYAKSFNNAAVRNSMDAPRAMVPQEHKDTPASVESTPIVTKCIRIIDPADTKTADNPNQSKRIYSKLTRQNLPLHEPRSSSYSQFRLGIADIRTDHPVSDRWLAI